MLPLSHASIQISFMGLLVFSFYKEEDGFPLERRSEEKTNQRASAVIVRFLLIEGTVGNWEQAVQRLLFQAMSSS